MATELTRSRDSNELIGFAIHHAGFANPTKGAANMAELLNRAQSYDLHHSFKDYSQPKNGSNDAKYTDGKLGYKWLLYHVLIARDGATLYVQDFKWERWHASDNWRLASSLNRHGVAILLDGNFEYENPTEQQIQAAAKVVYDYEQKQNQRGLLVLGHRETSGPAFPTGCPGKNMGTSLAGDVQRIRAIATAMHAGIPVPPIPPVPVPVPTPPTSNAPRLDVIAEMERIAIKNRDRVTNLARKNEWSRLLTYAINRKKEL